METLQRFRNWMGLCACGDGFCARSLAVRGLACLDEARYAGDVRVYTGQLLVLKRCRFPPYSHRMYVEKRHLKDPMSEIRASSYGRMAARARAAALVSRPTRLNRAGGGAKISSRCAACRCGTPAALPALSHRLHTPLCRVPSCERDMASFITNYTLAFYTTTTAPTRDRAPR